MIRVIVHGAGFSNKGAEAMLKTVQTELMRRLAQVEFLLWRCREGDYQVAQKDGFTPLPLPFESGHSLFRLLPRRIEVLLWCLYEIGRARDLRQLQSLCNRKALFARACGDYLERAIQGFDAYIDISGFAYGDAWGMGFFRSSRILKEYCRRHSKPAIYLPQSWGTFEDPQVRAALRGLLSGSLTHFYSRDTHSSRCLESALGMPDGAVSAFPDIAFRFLGGTAQQGEQLLRGMGCAVQRPLIGIAPNMRAYERAAGQGHANAYLQTLVGFANYCLENYDVDLVLQANEVDISGLRLDDRYLCSLLAASVNRPDRCFFTQEALSAEATKALIGHFQFLVASRYHSLVFALSQGVPCMAIGWSRKYWELFSLFGMGDEVQDCMDADVGGLISTFERGWNERDSRRAHILRRVGLLQLDVDAVFDDVACTIARSART